MRLARTVGALVFGALPLCAAAPAARAHDDAATACVEVGGASVWGGTGWNHVVYATNRCDKPVNCDVWTNVEPEKQSLSCATNQTMYVSTAVGSASQYFVPVVSCDFP